MGAFLRFIVEYVGNLHLSSRAERRTNRHARDLMDWIKGQMETRGFPAAKKRELVRDLRHAFRPGGPTPGAVTATDDTSGRDAPS
jgi:hypothetical protein